ncbi:MAG TPA: hypothetical protein VNE62_07065 [Actinomycetota bacterium]|nr:hypothetical protein [Actinomycetota bacterium]
MAYLALVVFIIIFCATESTNFDDYSRYWGLFATIVGVATGAMPSFFFQSQAHRATERAAQAEQNARKAGQRAELYAGIAPQEKVSEVQAAHRDLF